MGENMNQARERESLAQQKARQVQDAAQAPRPQRRRRKAGAPVK
jgi:hypothetical protein